MIFLFKITIEDLHTGNEEYRFNISVQASSACREH
jgi:hypothetical protein